MEAFYAKNPLLENILNHPTLRTVLHVLRIFNTLKNSLTNILYFPIFNKIVCLFGDLQSTKVNRLMLIRIKFEIRSISKINWSNSFLLPISNIMFFFIALHEVFFTEKKNFFGVFSTSKTIWRSFAEEILEGFYGKKIFWCPPMLGNLKILLLWSCSWGWHFGRPSSLEAFYTKKNSFCKIFTHPTQRSLPSLLRIFNNIEILLYDLSPSQYLLYFLILWHFLFIWRASCYEDLPSWSQTIIKKTLFSLAKFWTASNFQYLIFLRNPVSDSTFILISNFIFNFKMWLQFILIINCCKIYEL